jgi:hypothetical protein
MVRLAVGSDFGEDHDGRGLNRSGARCSTSVHAAGEGLAVLARSDSDEEARHCEERSDEEGSALRGAQRRSNPGFTAVKEKVWIASLRSQ